MANVVRDGLAKQRFWSVGLLAFMLFGAAGCVCASGAVLPSVAQQASAPAASVAASPQTAQRRTPEPEQSTPDHYELSPQRAKQARNYSRTLYSLYFVRAAVGVLSLILILQLGIAAKLRDVAESASGSRWLQALIFVPFVLVLLNACELPISMYGHAVSLRYNQSIQGWGSWFSDYAKAALLSLGFTIIVVWILDALLRRSPRRWWLYLWLALLPISAVLVFGAPLVLDPIFNHFQPLEQSHPALVTGIEEIAHHAGINIPPDRTFLMTASEKTNEMNAYVTGLGASKRVVVWDNTIKKLGRNETLFIIGHELGHYVLGHVWKGYLFFAGLLLVGLYAGFRALHWALSRWSAAWKIYSDRDWAAFVVILLVLQVLLFLSTPVANSFSRAEEHDADIYGLEVIHGVIPNEQQVATDAFQKLGEYDLADPDPPEFLKFWLYSHPPLADRLAFAHNYDPWAQGESPRYIGAASSQ